MEALFTEAALAARMFLPLLVATRTDTVDRNMALRTRLPAAVGAHVFTYLSARDHGAAAESCRYLLAVALQPAASPVCV